MTRFGQYNGTAWPVAYARFKRRTVADHRPAKTFAEKMSAPNGGEKDMNMLKCSLLSASFVALSTGWAAAAPAVVLDYLNLRYAPGYDQYIIEVIPPGWIVNTGACADGWCQVNVNGVLGFVDSDYLGAPAPGYWPSYGYAAWTYPNYAYYYGYGGYGYGGGPYVGPYGGVYAQGRNADLKAARRQVNRAKPAAVEKTTER